jgi:hypothetical protein
MPAEVQSGTPRIDLSRYGLSLDGRRVKLERQPMELADLPGGEEESTCYPRGHHWQALGQERLCGRGPEHQRHSAQNSFCPEGRSWPAKIPGNSGGEGLSIYW